jgi:NADPH2:quinone reductase
MKAVVVTALGGPDVLEVQEVRAPSPSADQLLVDVTVSGVNFRDVYERELEGYAPLGLPPFVAGMEGAGTVRAVGEAAGDFAPGDRVAWWRVPGSYAQQVAVPAAEAVPIPDGIDEATACAVLLQGLTAHALVDSSYAVQPGEWVLNQAAAGGVGLLLTQMAKLRGASVIGTTSTKAKAEIARSAGADVVLRYDEVPDRVREITGLGVDVAYDAVGAETFRASLRALRPRGTLVGYGFSTGHPPESVEPGRLGRKGLYLTWMLLPLFVETREELMRRSTELFGWIADGSLRATIGARYPLTDARQAQIDLAARKTVGKVLLEAR